MSNSSIANDVKDANVENGKATLQIYSSSPYVEAHIKMPTSVKWFTYVINAYSMALGTERKAGEGGVERVKSDREIVFKTTQSRDNDLRFSCRVLLCKEGNNDRRFDLGCSESKSLKTYLTPKDQSTPEWCPYIQSSISVSHPL
ncbi:hypothetical protein CEXT_640751 [Caerostris extrusa]|uniref:Uncharacterized protein n=1 Tax=Caerostris extrusa TaxID=172846 RepID=A0AAV4MWF0_CAEEX|nr:hypothetical protein CEXT_640751 [Caerostris extrusa]